MKILKLFIGVLIVSTSLFGAAPSYKQSTGNSCFKSRDLLFPVADVFDGLKQTLMQSNLNIVTVTKADGVLTAKGNQYNAEQETIIGVTVTIDFKERKEENNEVTSVKVIASYETIAKKNDTGQIGAGGVSLPIPVPFTGKYTLVGQGNIDDSNWYRGFFNSLDKILFENKMKYDNGKKVHAKPAKEELKAEDITKIASTSQKQNETLSSPQSAEVVTKNQTDDQVKNDTKAEVKPAQEEVKAEDTTKIASTSQKSIEAVAKNEAEKEVKQDVSKTEDKSVKEEVKTEDVTKTVSTSQKQSEIVSSQEKTETIVKNKKEYKKK